MTFIKGHSTSNDLFTQSTAVLHKYFEWRTKNTLLQFFHEVAQNSLCFPCSEKSWVLQVFQVCGHPVKHTTKCFQCHVLHFYASKMHNNKSYPLWQAQCHSLHTNGITECQNVFTLIVCFHRSLSQYLRFCALRGLCHHQSRTTSNQQPVLVSVVHVLHQPPQHNDD